MRSARATRGQGKVEMIEEETYEIVLKRLVKEGGVRGWIVVNHQGIPIKAHV